MPSDTANVTLYVPFLIS